MSAVVLVLGRSATGKTTLARVIAARFGIPLLAKDRFKELLFDTLGAGDLDWSQRLGRAAFALLDDAIARQLAVGGPFVADSNWDPRLAQQRFTELQREYGFEAVQVHCTGPADVLVRRFADRVASGERHPGHGDGGRIAEFRAALGDGQPEVLDLDGVVLPFDSTGEGATEALLAALTPLLA